MWRLKQFMPKEQNGLEGRSIEVGNLKVHIRNAIAEGGFSCVYLARDAVHSSKQYALKHMICNDDELLDLVKKEISVMKLLRGHPNVVSLQAQSIFDMGRTKEALLVMEFCEKSLVGVLENRGAAYFEEKQILLIFRDVCNAVFAMHCQSPPIAHRDLKAENVLLGPDGAWKLCDFGSTSTNHKRFDRPEEMGIEEDNIRKHTTPAYRAPEMWDLFRKEVISEKVDIWALGCLLYRICYLKSAFDGESKLQILNGNYRIPELPKYSSSITDLIKDLLQPSPDTRPDITQVWFRVNLQLPEELQKQMPDGSISMMTAADTHQPSHEAVQMPAKKAPLMPRRTPPPPPSSIEQLRHVSPSSLSAKDAYHSKASQGSSMAAGGGAPLGSFWSTQHANDSRADDKGPVYDDGPSGDFEIRFFPEKTEGTQPENTGTFQSDAFNSFVAEFDTSKLESSNHNSRRADKEELEAEVDRLKEQLKQANLEKAEITSKYEKLSAICRSQRQEIQELKTALASATPSPIRDGSKSQSSPGREQSDTTQKQQREKIEGSVWELQQGMFGNTNTPRTPSPDSKSWQAFAEQPQPQPLSKSNQARSVRTATNGHQNKSSTRSSGADNWGFGQDNFTAVPVTTGSHISKTSTHGNNSMRFNDSKNMENKPASQPAGWAGF